MEEMSPLGLQPIRRVEKQTRVTECSPFFNKNGSSHLRAPYSAALCKGPYTTIQWVDSLIAYNTAGVTTVIPGGRLTVGRRERLGWLFLALFSRWEHLFFIFHLKLLFFKREWTKKRRRKKEATTLPWKPFHGCVLHPNR